MTMKKLHPSVEQFKEFVKSHPKIMEEVRTDKVTLQELYEDWYLLGEDDSKWDDYRSEHKDDEHIKDTKADWMSKVLGTMKNMDSNQVQSYLGNLSQALGAVQGVIAQFQSGAAQKMTHSKQQKPNHPFVFRKD